MHNVETKKQQQDTTMCQMQLSIVQAANLEIYEDI